MGVGDVWEIVIYFKKLTDGYCRWNSIAAGWVDRLETQRGVKTEVCCKQAKKIPFS